MSDCQIWLTRSAWYFLCEDAAACSNRSWREGASAEETIERSGGQSGTGLAGRQLTQQCRAGTMWVLALEPLDEGGGFGRDGAHLTAVPTPC